LRENQAAYYVDYQKYFFKEICESVAFLVFFVFSEWTQFSILPIIVTSSLEKHHASIPVDLLTFANSKNS